MVTPAGQNRPSHRRLYAMLQSPGALLTGLGLKNGIGDACLLGECLCQLTCHVSLLLCPTASVARVHDVSQCSNVKVLNPTRLVIVRKVVVKRPKCPASTLVTTKEHMPKIMGPTSGHNNRTDGRAEMARCFVSGRCELSEFDERNGET